MSLIDFQPTYLKLSRDGEAVVAAFDRPNLSEDENIEQLGHELFSLVDQYDCRKVVLNLSAVEFVTSSFLGKMITLHRKLHRKDGKLVICHVHGGVADVMRSSRLLEYFHVTDSLDRALTEMN